MLREIHPFNLPLVSKMKAEGFGRLWKNGLATLFTNITGLAHRFAVFLLITGNVVTLSQ